MNVTKESLQSRFQSLSDETLLNRYLSGELTDLAQEVALAELHARGVSVPSGQENDEELEGTRPLVFSGTPVKIAQHLSWIEAQVLTSLLESEGVPAVTGDEHMATANHLFSVATGGVKIYVDSDFVLAAEKIIREFNQGKYDLDKQEP